MMIIRFMLIIILFSSPLYAAGFDWGAFMSGVNQGLENARRLEEIQMMQEQRRMLEQQRLMMEQEQQRMIEQQRMLREEEQRRAEQQRLSREQEQKRIEQQRQATEEERRRMSEAGKLTAEDWLNKMRTLLKDGKLTDPERAIEYLSEAIRLKPDFAVAYNGRGSAYADLKQHQRAIQDFDMAIRLKPDYVWAYNNRGIAHILSGNKPDGCSSLIRACELGDCKVYELAKQKGHCQPPVNAPAPSPAHISLAEPEKSPQVKAPAPNDELARDGRFIAYNNGTVLDTKTKLMWAAKDNGSNINWANAKSYCENYRGGGYSDWRMPTQDELEGLYDKGKSYKTTPSNFTVNLIELIQLSSCWPWASETRGSDAAHFNFLTGKWNWLHQSYDTFNRALPVRSGK
jgi:tetratricopeptide (TPR) repeat protein